MGRPLLLKPPGTDIPGRPARLVDRVKMSERYMASGSSTFSPFFQAGVGETGEISRSHDSQARLKSLRIKVLTWDAFL